MARITVVNDSPEFLDLVQDILEGDRYDTVLVDGAQADALQVIRQSKPDLLMIDLRLGGEGIHGWDLARQVRADPEFDGLPVLLCSGDLRAMREIEADLAPDRHVATLGKPFELDELTATIDRLLDEAAPR